MWRSVSVAGALDYRPEAIEPDAYAAAARDALAEGNLLDAQSLAVRATELFRLTGKERQLAHALMLRGDIARARGDLSYAEDNFREALSHFSALQDRNHTASTLSALGEVRAMEGDFQRAEEFQRLAVDTLPTDIAALIGLGYAQWYGDSPANAEATFTQALAWDAAAPLAISGRGQVRAELREYGAALADLDRALSSGLAPDDETDARSARALALAGLGHARRQSASWRWLAGGLSARVPCSGRLASRRLPGATRRPSENWSGRWPRGPRCRRQRRRRPAGCESD